MTVLDKLGQEITEGCFLVYGHALGRSAGLRVGKVLEVTTRKNWSGQDEMVIVVWGVDDDWPGNYAPALCKSKGFLDYPDRTVVLAEANVSELYRTLLAPVTLESTWKSLGSVKEERHRI